MISQKNATFFILFLSIFVVIFVIMSFDGYFFYDDNDYINYAHQITTGKFQIWDNIFPHRLGIILPLSALLKVFGFSDVAVVALPLICMLACLWALWDFFISKNLIWGVWTCIFFSLDFYTLFFANKIYPDVLLTLFALGAVLTLFKRNNKAVLSGILFVLFNFLAFISKELIVYILPFYVFIFAQDMYQKRNFRFWRWSIFLGFFVLLAYFGAYYYHTGDFFYRFRSIENGRYEAVSSYFDKPISVLLARLTYEPIIMFITGTTMIVFAGALPSFWRVFKRIFSETIPNKPPLNLLLLERFEYKIENYFTWLCVSILACFWFGSTSFEVYNPIGLFPRMILFVVPFLAVLAGLNFLKINQNQKYQYFFGIIFLLSGVIAMQVVGLKTALIYFLISFWLIFYKFIYKIISKIILNYLKNKKLNLDLFLMFGFVLIMLIHPVFSMLKSTETGYKTQKDLLQSYFSEEKTKENNLSNKEIIIFSDHTTENGKNIYFDFKRPKNITFKRFEDTLLVIKTEKSSAKYYMLMNDFSVEKLPSILPNWKLVEGKNKIKIYEIQLP